MANAIPVQTGSSLESTNTPKASPPTSRSGVATASVTPVAAVDPALTTKINEIKTALAKKISPFISDFNAEYLPPSFDLALTGFLKSNPAPVKSDTTSSLVPVPPPSYKQEDLNKVFATLDYLIPAGFVMRATKDVSSDSGDVANIVNAQGIQTPIPPKPKEADEAENEHKTKVPPINIELQKDFIQLISKIPISSDEAGKKAKEGLIDFALCLNGETGMTNLEQKLSNANSENNKNTDSKENNKYTDEYLYLVAQLYRAMYQGAEEAKIGVKVEKIKESLSDKNAENKLQAIFNYFQKELTRIKQVHLAWMQEREQEPHLLVGLTTDVGELIDLYQKAQEKFGSLCYKATASGIISAATATATTAAVSFSDKRLLQLSEEEKKQVKTVEYAGGMLGKSTVMHCVQEKDKYPAGSSILKTNGEPLTVDMVRVWLSTFAAGHRILDVSKINNKDPVFITIPSVKAGEENKTIKVTTRKLVEIVAQTRPLNHIVIGGGALQEGFAQDSDLKELRDYVTGEIDVPLSVGLNTDAAPASSQTSSVSPPSPPPPPPSSSTAASVSTPPQAMPLSPSSPTTSPPPSSSKQRKSAPRIGEDLSAVMPSLFETGFENMAPKSKQQSNRHESVGYDIALSSVPHPSSPSPSSPSSSASFRGLPPIVELKSLSLSSQIMPASDLPSPSIAAPSSVSTPPLLVPPDSPSVMKVTSTLRKKPALGEVTDGEGLCSSKGEEVISSLSPCDAEKIRRRGGNSEAISVNRESGGDEGNRAITTANL